MSHRNKSRCTSKSLPHVIVVGAGFGGLAAAKVLSVQPINLTIIDRSNHHLFQPLLYQVATAGLSPADIAMPIRAIFSMTQNSEVLLAQVERIDLTSQQIVLDRNETLTFDYLILATGARHQYFGHPQWEVFAPGLKTLEDATEIRRRILLAFEEAERKADHALENGQMTFVIVGGGPTGIELAGAIAELAKFALQRDFKHINPPDARVILVEAGKRLLPEFSEISADRALKALRQLGVEVMLGSPVTDMNDSGVFLSDAFIPAKTVLWAAGVKASSLGASLGVATDKAGRVFVKNDLSLPGFQNIFVVGDLAAIPISAQKFVPGVAPAAMQAGRHAAKNILALMAGKTTAPFRYIDKGSLATIGRAAAVVQIGSWQLSGVVAWFIWLAVHIVYLIGFRNRVLVLLQWAWSYLTFKRGTRLITGRKG